MNNADNMIPFFTTCFQVCLAFTILFFVISVILFFVFDIRTIFNIRTGRAKRKTISEMQKANSKTGRLRVDGKTLTEQLDKAEKKHHRTPIINAARVKDPDYADSSSTQVLNEADEKTSVLASSPAFNNREYVTGTDFTAPLGEYQNTQQSGNYNAEYADVHFVVIKKTMIVNTNEVI